MEMKDVVLSIVGAQDMDISGYQVLNLKDIEFYWKTDQLDVHAVFRHGKDTSYSPTAPDDHLEMAVLA